MNMEMYWIEEVWTGQENNNNENGILSMNWVWLEEIGKQHAWQSKVFHYQQLMFQHACTVLKMVLGFDMLRTAG